MLISSISYLLFYVNTFIQAVDIFLITNYALLFKRSIKKSRVYRSYVIILWGFAVFLSIVFIAGSIDSPKNAFCCFNSLSFKLSTTRVIFTLVYVIFPLIIEIVVAVLSILSVISVKSSHKVSRGVDLSVTFVMKMIITFGITFLYTFLIVPFLILETLNIGVWKVHAKWTYMYVMVLSFHGLLNTNILFIRNNCMKRLRAQEKNYIQKKKKFIP